MPVKTTAFKRMIATALIFIFSVCAFASCTPEDVKQDESDVSGTSEAVDVPLLLDGAKLVVFGDSITAMGTWGRRVADSANMHYFNGAMGGTTTEDGLKRLEAFVLSREPDIVTICYGMNDMLMTATDVPRVTPEKFAENLTEMVLAVRAAGAEPILMTTNPLDNSVFFSSQGQDRSHYVNAGTPLEWLDVYNGQTRQVAKEQSCLLADMRAACGECPEKTTVADGIHLSEAGNTVFAETLLALLLESFTSDPTAPRVDNDAAKVIAAGESFSLMPEDEGGFYVPDGMLTVRKTPAGYELFNTNGLWPEAHYSFDMPVAVSADAALVCRLSTASVGASLILFFSGATPTAAPEGYYFRLDPFLGCETEPVSGDILPAQTVDITIPLRSLPLPSAAFDDEGRVVISGLKIFVAGTAYQKLTVEELSINA